MEDSALIGSSKETKSSLLFVGLDDWQFTWTISSLASLKTFYSELNAPNYTQVHLALQGNMLKDSDNSLDSFLSQNKYNMIVGFKTYPPTSNQSQSNYLIGINTTEPNRDIAGLAGIISKYYRGDQKQELPKGFKSYNNMIIVDEAANATESQLLMYAKQKNTQAAVIIHMAPQKGFDPAIAQKNWLDIQKAIVRYFESKYTTARPVSLSKY